MNLLKTIIIIIVVTILSFPLTKKKVEAGWCTEIVDGEGVVGEYTSLELDSSDNPHISYFDRTNFDLKYAYRDGSSWQIGIADSFGNVGNHNSLALDSSGHPHISYFDDTNDDLKYTRCESGCGDQDSWQKVTVDDIGIVGIFTSLTLDSRGYPHISYQDYTGNALKYAWCESDCADQNSWQKITVDDIGIVGLFTSLTLDRSGHPHISYFDDTNDDLKYAWCESGCSDQVNWEKVTIDPGSVSLAPTAIAIDSNNKIHIIYHDTEHHALKYACCESGCSNQLNWQIEMVNEDYIDICTYSLALDNNNNPHISYCGGFNKDLQYVHKFEGNWTIPQMVNCSSDPLVYSSLALDNNNNPHISFCDSTNWDLRFAFIDIDSDNDGIAEAQDNCQNTSNGPCLGTCYSWSEMLPCTTDTDCPGPDGFCSMNQEDTYPPGRNGIGDVCDCEADFNCDGNVDAGDVTSFLTDFGRSIIVNPCTNTDPCHGDFDCNVNVDAADVPIFLEDFGRSIFNNPCPTCIQGTWCAYE